MFFHMFSLIEAKQYIFYRKNAFPETKRKNYPYNKKNKSSRNDKTCLSISEFLIKTK